MNNKKTPFDPPFSREEAIKEIKEKISQANLPKAYGLMLAQATELKIDPEEIQKLEASFIHSKKQFDRNIIPKTEFDRAFSKSVDAIFTLLDDEAPVLPTFWQKFKTIVILGALLSLSGIVLWTFSNGQKGVSTDEQTISFERLDNDLRKIGDVAVKFQEKDKLIKVLINALDSETIVEIRSKNGNTLNQYQLEDFLEQLKFGTFEGLRLDKIEHNKIIARYQ